MNDMNKAILEIVVLGICFVLVMTASVLIYNGNYSDSAILLIIVGILLVIYIVTKLLKKII